MEKELEQFREEVRRLRAGRRSGSLPFPETLRAFAVRYVEQAVADGRTKTEAVAKLGVSEPTVNAWKKGLPASRPRARGAPPPAGADAPLVPIIVTPQKRGRRAATPATAAASTGIAVVSPAGWRVEGLTPQGAAALLKEMAC